MGISTVGQVFFVQLKRGWSRQLCEMCFTKKKVGEVGCINGMIATYTNINSLPFPLLGRRIPKFWHMRLESCDSRGIRRMSSKVMPQDVPRKAVKG